ncbi:MAG: hypothetical protein ABFD50_19530 [Smithella sp.]
MLRTRKFCLVLLSLVLIIAFYTSAFAVDVKFSGSYYVAGAYLDKANLVKDTTAANTALGSTAFYFQRLQLSTEFVIAPGASLITRANIMERVWGGIRTPPGTTLDNVDPNFTSSAATRAENQNIGLDYAYLKLATPIGLIMAGYMSDGVWGTIFHNNDTAAANIIYVLPVDKWIFGIGAVKVIDNSYSSSNLFSTNTDVDSNKYYSLVIYQNKNFEGGIIYVYISDASNRNISDLRTKFHIIEPYFKAIVGPVKIQAELDYYFGDFIKFDKIPDGFSDQKIDSLTGWIDAVATFGKFYIGGTFAYSQGQGTDDSTLNEWASSGKDWSPTLIMWNSDRNYWLGNINGNGTSNFKYAMTNAFFYQLKAGVMPTDKLDIGASVAFAHADTLNDLTYGQAVIGTSIGLTSKAGYVSKNYGWEIDVIGTYKITDNLSYMAGFGYLFTGDYFKATSSTNSVTDDYLLINKLTFTF